MTQTAQIYGIPQEVAFYNKNNPLNPRLHIA